jgi:penicillin-binding protein 1A
VVAAFAGDSALVVGMYRVLRQRSQAAEPESAGRVPPKQVTRILDRNNVPIGELGSEKRTVVPYSAIPKMLVQAVVAGEDADYFKHGGVDYMGMRARSSTNVLRGRTAQGGSTITQQVVKTCC